MIPEYPIGPMPPFFFSLNGNASSFDDSSSFSTPKITSVYHSFEKFEIPEDVEAEDENNNDLFAPYTPLAKQLLFVDPLKSPYLPFTSNSISNKTSKLHFLPSEFCLPEDDYPQVTKIQCDDFNLL